MKKKFKTQKNNHNLIVSCRYKTSF